jgi:protein gp37
MTKIEWTDETWNPTTGCNKVSAGCLHCYAEGVAGRFWGDREFTDVRFHPERLEIPLKWKKPRKVFVNSMSDLFHESLTDEQVDQVFAVMAMTPKHTYQVLTKRPERMLNYLSFNPYGQIIPKDLLHIQNRAVLWSHAGGNVAEKLGKFDEIYYENPWIYHPSGDESPDAWLTFPLVNVWVGVSAENQEMAEKRIPLLLQTPAALRFVSCEPLLGNIDLTPWLYGDNRLDWVIVGGESGQSARACRLDWIRAIAKQCQKAGAAVFVKQAGSNAISNDAPLKLKNRKGGDLDELPVDLRVRQFPTANGKHD